MERNEWNLNRRILCPSGWRGTNQSGQYTVFKDETDTTGGGTDGDVKSTTTDLGNGTYSTDNSNLSSNYNSNEPNFFL